jgi:hypothetical protein
MPGPQRQLPPRSAQTNDAGAGSVDELARHHRPQSAVVGEVVLAHRFRLPFGFRRFAHCSTSGRFQTRVARRRTIGSGKSGSPVKRIAFRRVVPRSSATSARPRRFLPAAVIRPRWCHKGWTAYVGPTQAILLLAAAVREKRASGLKSAPFHAKQRFLCLLRECAAVYRNPGGPRAAS